MTIINKLLIYHIFQKFGFFLSDRLIFWMSVDYVCDLPKTFSANNKGSITKYTLFQNILLQWKSVHVNILPLFIIMIKIHTRKILIEKVHSGCCNIIIHMRKYLLKINSYIFIQSHTLE